MYYINTQVLQYADGNAEKMLRSRDFLNLSEHMLLVVMQRDIQVCILCVNFYVCLLCHLDWSSNHVDITYH